MNFEFSFIEVVFCKLSGFDTFNISKVAINGQHRRFKTRNTEISDNVCFNCGSTLTQPS